MTAKRYAPALRQTLTCVVLSLLAGGLAACGGNGAASSDVVVGAVQPMSGALASYGEATQAGFQYVIDEVNRDGGIGSMDGARIKVELADTGSDPTKAASEARRLAVRRDAAILVGNLQTPDLAAITPVARQLGTAVIAFNAGGSPSDQIYSLGMPYDEGYAAGMADFAGWLNSDQDAGIRTAALALINTEAGQLVAKSMTDRLKKLGIRVVENVPMTPGASSYKPALTKIAAARPDVVFGMLLTNDAITFQKDRASVGDDLLVVGSAGFADPLVWRSLDERTRAVMADGTFSTTTYSPEANKNVKPLLEAAKKQGAEIELGDQFVQGAQAARLVVRAIEKAGSGDPADVLAALGDVEIPADSADHYLPMTGPISLSPKTHMLTSQPTLVIQWGEDGTRSVVFPGGLASADPRLAQDRRPNGGHYEEVGRP